MRPDQLPIDGVLAVAIVEGAPDAIVVVGPDGTIVYANGQAGVTFGHEVDDLLGERVEVLVPFEQAARHVELRRSYEQAPHSRAMGPGLALAARRADGSTFPVEIALSPIDTPAGRHTVAIVRDVTEQRRTSDALATTAERERIARELHDTVIQHLFGIGMALQGIAAGADDALAIRMQDTVDRLDGVVRDIRAAVFGWSPDGRPPGA